MHNKKILISLLLSLAVILLTAGFAAFKTDLFIDGMKLSVRVTKDIRITGISLQNTESENDGTSTSRYEEYNVSNITTGITLPNENSTITYKVEVTNYGNVDMGILKITGLEDNDNIAYELSGYNLKDKICNEDNKCNSGIKKYVYITFKYKNFNPEKISYDIRLDFDFRQFYSISYEDIDISEPNEILGGDNLILDLTGKNVGSVGVEIDGLDAVEYTYENNILTMGNVPGNLNVYRATLYRIMKKSSVLDNTKSDYVTSSTGINFNAISSNTNGKGVYEMASTASDEYPIYYYRGQVTDNNVIFANYCWQMVRTTNTGGVKLIYNGVPTDGTCVATGSGRQIGTSAINSSYTSLAYFGYMYGNVYNRSSKNIGSTYWYNYGNKTTTTKNILTSTGSRAGKTFYFSKDIEYDETTKKYSLVNPESLTWNDNYSNLKGYYTFLSTSSTYTNATVYYVSGASSSNSFALGLTAGKKYEDVTMKISSNVSYDSDAGKYSLVESETIKLGDWYDNYASYKGKYYCPDYSEECSEVYYVNSTTNYQAVVVSMSNAEDYESVYQAATDKMWYFGNSYDYDELTNTYTLKDTKEISPMNWASAYNTINKNHYACFNNAYNSDKTCSTLYYVYYTSNSAAYYLPMTNGKTIDQYIAEMTTESSNEKNSTMKTYVDKWYGNNLASYTDNYIEDTVFCNDRRIGSYGGWNPNGGSTTSSLTTASYARLVNNKTPSLSCSKNDSFTVNESSTGNGKLKYPVGLLTADEVAYAGGRSGSNNTTYYLYTGSTWVTMSLSYFSDNIAYVIHVNYAGSLRPLYSVDNGNGVRPSVSLLHGITPSSGIGTATNPYVIE